MSPISFTGLSSGIDTNQIIQQVTRFQQDRISSLQGRVDEAVNRQTVFKEVEARLLTLRSVTRPLSLAQNGILGSKRITSSDETLVKAAAGTGAENGTHTFRVKSLARNHQVASQGFEASTSSIREGEYQIGTVSEGTTTITIDSGNSTLEGLAQAINNADVGVTATIIDDGSDSQPVRLLLSADKAGTANMLDLSVPAGLDDAPNFADKLVGAAFTASWIGPTIDTSGSVYNGSANKTFTFEVNATADKIIVTDSTGVNHGEFTVAPSGEIDGLTGELQDFSVKFGPGSLQAGESFTVDVFVPTVQEAANAAVQIGSGDGAITVESPNNQIQDLFPGVTLDLQKADPTKDVTLTVEDDKSAIRQGIVDLVDSFNELMDFIDEQTRFDSETGTAGPLNGNSGVISLQDTVRRTILSVSTLIPVGINRLSALGITVARGRLQLNQARMDGVLNDLDARQLQQLFALDAGSDNAGITFVSGTDRTMESINGSHEVDLSQAAEKGAITGGALDGTSTTLGAGDNQLSLTVNGEDVNATLATGTSFSRLELAAHVEAQVNAQLDSGNRVEVSLEDVPEGQGLVITSDRFGSSSEVTMKDAGANSAHETLKFADGQNGRGQDVGGAFIVKDALGNETRELASGNGQYLLGHGDNENTADLQVRVTLTSSQVNHGTPEGNLTVSRGVASRLGLVMDQLLDPVSGRLKGMGDRFQQQIDNANADMTRESTEMDEHQAALLRQFAEMESAISRAQSQGDLITTRLQSLLFANQDNNNQ